MAMTKRVNINARIAIRNINPPIYGICKDIVMSTGDILKCICKRAIVDEILPDGTTVRLNMRNYCTDNGAGLDASKYIIPVETKNDESELEADDVKVDNEDKTADEDVQPDSIDEGSKVEETANGSEDAQEDETSQDVAVEDETSTDSSTSDNVVNEETANSSEDAQEEAETTEVKKPTQTKSTSKKKKNSNK